MKEVYVLRHSEWNGKEDTLTEQGKSDAEEYSDFLPKFDIVYSSPLIRTQQTAELISKAKPRVKTNASTPQLPVEIKDKILERRSTHPLGIAGAYLKPKKLILPYEQQARH